MESLRADVGGRDDAKRGRGRWKCKETASGQALEAAKNTRRTGLKSEEQAREDVKGGRRRGGGGARVEKEREGPRRAEEGIDHSSRLWVA